MRRALAFCGWMGQARGGAGPNDIIRGRLSFWFMRKPVR